MEPKGNADFFRLDRVTRPFSREAGPKSPASLEKGLAPCQTKKLSVSMCCFVWKEQDT